MPDYKYVPSNGHKLYNHLVAVPDAALFHERHGEPMGHPADILAEKLTHVVDLYQRVVDDLKTGSAPATRGELTKALVFSINEFYDQLFLIIKALTPPGQALGQRQSDVLSWLRSANGATLNKFYAPTKGEHSLIRDIANVLKHQPSDIDFVEVDNHHGVTVHGFIVKVVIGADDLRGPSRAIHAMYKGTVNTGISYNHFLLNVVGRVLSYLDRLDAALFSPSSPEVNRRFAALDRLLAAAKTVQSEFFPDEYSKPLAELSERKETQVVKFPARPRIERGENPAQIMGVRWPGVFNQRTSRSHQMLPYLQLTRPELGLR